MIPKASQRSGGQQLATHLLNEQENDRVEVMDVRGAVANDLHGAFAEWAATATGTKCQKYLYSLSINPDPAHGALTRAQYLDFINRVEKKMGLSEQPRAVVFHVKHGREHAHVVWSRINLEKMKAVHMAHDRQKLRAVVQEFAREHGLRLPRGMKNNRGLERFNEHAKGVSLAEKQQEERTGLTKGERRQIITEAWRQHNSGKAFVRALENKGYRIAHGQRGYVLVDGHGEIHSLARQIEGVKARDVKARLKDAYPLEHLPDAQQLQNDLRKRNQEKIQTRISEAFQKHAVNQRELLRRNQQERRANFENKHKTILDRHRDERAAILAAQKKERHALALKQQKEKPKGLKALLGKVTGKEAALQKTHIQQQRQLIKQHHRALKTLATRHNREAGNINRRFRALLSVEKRETRSLSTALQRRQLISLAQEYRAAQKEARKPLAQEFSRAAPPIEQGRQPSKEQAPSPVLTPSQEETLEDIRQTGQDIVQPAGPEAEQAQDPLAEAFRRAQKQKEKRDRQKGQDRDPGRGMSR